MSTKRNSGIVLTFSLSFIDLIHVYSSACRFVGSVTVFSQLESKVCEEALSRALGGGRRLKNGGEALAAWPCDSGSLLES